MTPFFSYLLLLFVVASLRVDDKAPSKRAILPILLDQSSASHSFEEKERTAELWLDAAEGAFADLN